MADRRDKDGAELSAFAEELKAARQHAGWSSEELADRLGYSASTVRMVESGHRVPQPDFGVRLSRQEVTAWGHIGLAGSFTIAEAPDGSVTALVDHSADGQTIEDAERVSQVVTNFEALRGEALTTTASRELSLKVAEQTWKPAKD